MLAHESSVTILGLGSYSDVVGMYLRRDVDEKRMSSLGCDFSFFFPLFIFFPPLNVLFRPAGLYTAHPAVFPEFISVPMGASW